MSGLAHHDHGTRIEVPAEPESPAAEAKYMIVSCSAIVGYLLELCTQHGMPLEG
jgi:hypothetical protein